MGLLEEELQMGLPDYLQKLAYHCFRLEADVRKRPLGPARLQVKGLADMDVYWLQLAEEDYFVHLVYDTNYLGAGRGAVELVHFDEPCWQEPLKWMKY
jgi:hypothetical protein